MRQALTDVDEEVARLNRVVNDVLDFARPIRFDYAPADVNALCADAEEATRAGHQDIHVTYRIRSGAPGGRDRRRAPADRAREHPDERTPRGRGAIDIRSSAGLLSPEPRQLTLDCRRHHHHHAPRARLVPHHRSRSRRRREARRSAPRVRSVLHDQAHGLGPGPGDCQEHHRGHGRLDRAREPSRRRHGHPHRSPDSAQKAPHERARRHAPPRRRRAENQAHARAGPARRRARRARSRQRSRGAARAGGAQRRRADRRQSDARRDRASISSESWSRRRPKPSGRRF